MASDNETVAEIAAHYRAVWQGCEGVSLSEYEGKDVLELIDRFEAAHKQEVAKLRECLKEAVDLRCGRLTCEEGVCFYSESGKENECTAFKWRKALEGAKDDSTSR